MKIKRLMIAAPMSASGKTSITVALLKTLRGKGLNAVSVKCGPDYIDPLFHRTVLGVKAYNLDTFFTDEKTTTELFVKDCSKADIAVMEGVMGLYDGVGGVLEEGSSYALAKVTSTPIILVVNAKGAGRSIVALIKGFLDYDTEGLIKGVILNRVSEHFYPILKTEIEKELPISVLGFMPDVKEIHLESRHLGLVTPDSVERLSDITGILAETFEKNADVDAILEIASDTGDYPSETESKKTEEKCIIAVTKDEAFSFFYEENLRMLEECGAKIVFFSPLHDEEVPKESDGIILTGGYPELYLENLCSNTGMKNSIRKRIDKGMPVIAECGGFLYLHGKIKDCDGKAYEGVGVIDADCYYTGKSVRFGYIEIREKDPCFLSEGDTIKGHEFHYYESEENGKDCVAKKPFGKKEYECIHKRENAWVGFAHLYYPSNPEFAAYFVKIAEEYRKRVEV